MENEWVNALAATQQTPVSDPNGEVPPNSHGHGCAERRQWHEFALCVKGLGTPTQSIKRDPEPRAHILPPCQNHTQSVPNIIRAQEQMAIKLPQRIWLSLNSFLSPSMVRLAWPQSSAPRRVG